MASQTECYDIGRAVSLVEAALKILDDRSLDLRARYFSVFAVVGHLAVPMKKFADRSVELKGQLKILQDNILEAKANLDRNPAIMTDADAQGLHQTLCDLHDEFVETKTIMLLDDPQNDQE